MISSLITGILIGIVLTRIVIAHEGTEPDGNLAQEFAEDYSSGGYELYLGYNREDSVIAATRFVDRVYSVNMLSLDQTVSLINSDSVSQLDTIKTGSIMTYGITSNYSGNLYTVGAGLYVNNIKVPSTSRTVVYKSGVEIGTYDIDYWKAQYPTLVLMEAYASEHKRVSFKGFLKWINE